MKTEIHVIFNQMKCFWGMCEMFKISRELGLDEACDSVLPGTLRVSSDCRLLRLHCAYKQKWQLPGRIIEPQRTNINDQWWWGKWGNNKLLLFVSLRVWYTIHNYKSNTQLLKTTQKTLVWLTLWLSITISDIKVWWLRITNLQDTLKLFLQSWGRLTCLSHLGNVRWAGTDFITSYYNLYKHYW